MRIITAEQNTDKWTESLGMTLVRIRPRDERRDDCQETERRRKEVELRNKKINKKGGGAAKNLEVEKNRWASERGGGVEGGRVREKSFN